MEKRRRRRYEEKKCHTVVFSTIDRSNDRHFCINCNAVSAHPYTLHYTLVVCVRVFFFIDTEHSMMLLCHSIEFQYQCFDSFLFPCMFPHTGNSNWRKLSNHICYTVILFLLCFFWNNVSCCRIERVKYLFFLIRKFVSFSCFHTYTLYSRD